MEYQILEKSFLAPRTARFVIEAPHIARAFRPGQFLILKHDDDEAERIPLSIADVDPAGTVTIVVVAVGRSSSEIVDRYSSGDTFFSLLGPLGVPLEVGELGGALVTVGGGFGAAALYPIARAYKRAGNRVVAIVGARTEELLLYRREMAALCDRVVLTTDDGSAGVKGLVTDGLARVLAEEDVALVVAIGPVAMMRAVAEATRPAGIRTLASINPIMIDGTGMCGGCRVMVGGTPRFTCFEGPKFDAHQVDFDDLSRRLSTYRDQEAAALSFQTCETERALDLHARLGELDRAEPLYPPQKPRLPGDLKLPAPKKHRLKIPRQQGACQEPRLRVHNFAEVSAGLDADCAVVEAFRCIECKDAPCIPACPAHVDIPRFLSDVRERRFADAFRTIFRDNPFPAVCGRVCPQEQQCEAACTIGKKVEPVAIGRLERFVADRLRDDAADGFLPPRQPATGCSVAVVGSGPAGLACAFDLALQGHRVVVYEALHRPGGVLSYGIPPFRLPRSVVGREIDRLRKLGVEIVTDHLVGRTETIDDLRARHDAVFIGTGAGHPVMLGLPGEALKGIYSANEFLLRINLMHADEFPRHPTPVWIGATVAVIGGGNTALDAARAARRLGGEKVLLVYRRGRGDMPARAEEVCHAAEEGIEIVEFAAPLEFRGNERGSVSSVVCARTEYWGEPDPGDSLGRRRVREVPGSRFDLPVGTVINAVGFVCNPLIPQTTPGLRTARRNVIVADDEGRTSLERVFAGGDAIVGGATVISALGQGKRAARAIGALLSKGREPEGADAAPVAEGT